MWNGKQKRCYHRIMSGITYHNANKGVIRFLTLTSSKKAKRDIQQDFRVLKMRIIRTFGVFEYIKVRTNEGYGVLHVLYVGKFIPQFWLSRNWLEIHQSSIVDIRSTSRFKGLGKYVVSQYLSNQKCSFIRYSWSWGWVYRGFVRYWRYICICSKNPIDVWNLHLSGHYVTVDQKILKPPPDVKFVMLEQTTLDLDIFLPPYTYPKYFARLNERCGWLND